MTGYFSNVSLSKSQLKYWDSKNPSKFWDNCVFNSNRKAHEDTDYTAMGSLYHMMFFQRDLVKDNFMVADGLGKSRDTVKWSNAQANEKKTIVSSLELAHATRMADALFKHDSVKQLLKLASCESPFFWHDKAYGIDCKMRTDSERNTEDGLEVTDLKTTAKEFPKFIDKEKLEYEIGMYSRGMMFKYGQPIKRFNYIFQSTKEGEENNIRVKVVEGAQLEACQIATDCAMRDITARIKAWEVSKDEKIWLPEVKPEVFEVSPWYDKELSQMVNKGE